MTIYKIPRGWRRVKRGNAHCGDLTWDTGARAFCLVNTVFLSHWTWYDCLVRKCKVIKKGKRP
jgi:hypothetical protein